MAPGAPINTDRIVLPDSSKLAWLFFSMSGRVGRASYILAGLFVLIVQMFLFYQVLRFPQGSAAGQGWAFAFMIAAFVSLWANFALTAKRLHDFGRPGAFALVTLIVGFVVFIVLAFVRGDPGPNRYGDRPDAPAPSKG
jgi:uncharacterized membrane protein YhaH (DUF805 family)